MTLADLHANSACTGFEMYVHGCSMRQTCLADLRACNDSTCFYGCAWMLNASGITLADLHAFITLNVPIQLTIPQYVVYYPVHISYQVFHVQVLLCTLPTTRVYMK